MVTRYLGQRRALERRVSLRRLHPRRLPECTKVRERHSETGAEDLRHFNPNPAEIAFRVRTVLVRTPCLSSRIWIWPRGPSNRSFAPRVR